MSCPTKAESFPNSQPQNANPCQTFITTRFVFNSDPLASVLLSLTDDSILVNGDLPINLIPRKIIQLDSEIAYRIDIPSTSQTQEKSWFLQIISNDFRLRLEASGNENCGTWDDVLRQRIAKHGFWEDYKPVRRISKGLTSAVYEVTRVKCGAKFAVKAFSKKTLDQNPEVAKGLELEISLLRQIRKMQHTNLLGLQEVYLSESSIYLVMQLCGRDLIHGFSHIDLQHDLKVRQIMKQLISGLQALHEKGVIHRDIKPNNIMFKIGKKLELVIVDFGLSVQVGAQHPFVRCGTPGFIAPEVFALKDREMLRNHACDMFAIGSVFHLLLTGELLFSAASSAQVFAKNKKMDFDLSQDKYHKISPCSMNLIKMMLIVDPQERITAKEALKHEYFIDLETKPRSPAPTFLSANLFQFANDQQFSEINIGMTGRKRIKGEYRKASQL